MCGGTQTWAGMPVAFRTGEGRAAARSVRTNLWRTKRHARNSCEPTFSSLVLAPTVANHRRRSGCGNDSGRNSTALTTLEGSAGHRRPPTETPARRYAVRVPGLLFPAFQRPAESGRLAHTTVSRLDIRSARPAPLAPRSRQFSGGRAGYRPCGDPSLSPSRIKQGHQ